MSTRKLYYDDPYQFEFDAEVLDQFPVESRFGVVLDQTAFYPTSGGQPNDLGHLGDVPLVDCYEDELAGRIVHIAEKLIDGTRVHGIVDGRRRVDHMQQHSGQHVLSQAFVELLRLPTVSFHLGATSSTIDLTAENLSWDAATRVAERANRVILDARPVTVRYVEPEAVGDAGLRKPTDRTGAIRVVEVLDFDKSACCGTHVRHTGEIGPILITRIDRAKKQTRVEFLCGERTLVYARAAHRTLDAIGRMLSIAPLETDRAVQALLDESVRSRKRTGDLEELLIDYEARGFAVEDGVASAVFQGRSLDYIKLLAQKICEQRDAVALFADQGEQIRLVFARSASGSADVSAILKKVIARFGGKGGGRPNIAQGGGAMSEKAETVLEYARSLLRG